MNHSQPFRGGLRVSGFSLLIAVYASLAALPARAQLPGLDAPQAIGAYLNGGLPSSTPGLGTGGWDVVNAFPNLTFLDPVYLTPEPASDRLFVVGKPGIVYSFANNPAATQGDVTTVIDIRHQVRVGGDTGMLNMAFHPEYGQPSSPNRDYFYLWYRYTPDPSHTSGFATPGYIRLSRFTISQLTGVADPASEFVLIQQFDRHDWHNGGGMFFGPDGFLYVTVGDEGGADDEYDSSQKINGSLLGGVLRIDVDMDPARAHPIRRQPQNPANPPNGWPDSFTANYYIPNDNPWVDPSGNTLEEFYAIGLRSPHTMSRDPQTGWAFIGDVGQGNREEISFLEKGANYQWPYREGLADGPGDQPGALIGNDTPPVWDYGRNEGGCVIGGVVYRGDEHAGTLGGKYLFGDHNSRNIWVMTFNPGQSTSVDLLAQMPPTVRNKGQLASFGLDHAGEVYMCKPDGTEDPGGRIYKLTRTGTAAPNPPAFLSQTGAFADLADLTPAPGIIPYGMQAPLWSDGAIKSRWLAIPNDGTHDTPSEKIVFSENGNWTFPIGSVLMKHFEIPLDERFPNGARRRLETRFLVRGQDGEYFGMTYKWRPDNSDADLVAAEGIEEPVDIIDADGQPLTLDWLYPGRGACATCHTPQAGRVLGPRTRQLNGDYFYLSTGRTANQLQTLNHLGIFSPALDPAALSTYLSSANIDDTGASLQKRALSYVDSNCMQCHQPGGAALALFDARLSTPPAAQGMIGGEVINNLGIPGAEIVKAQDVAGSILYSRMNTLAGCCPMPPLAKNRLDTNALAVIADWIQSLEPGAIPPGSSSAGVPGVAFEYFEGSYGALPNFDNLTPVLTGTGTGFDLGPRLREDDFAFRFRAKLFVEAAGIYTFYTSSDDGSRLFIDGNLVVNNDGLHGFEEKEGSVSNIGTGYHDIEVTFFDALEDNLLEVSWAGPGLPKQPIAPQNLFLGNLDLDEPLGFLATPLTNVNGSFPVSVAFSEPVTGLSADDFTIQNASLSGFAGNNASYSLTLTPAAKGNVSIQLPSDSAIDGAANSNPPSNTLTVTFAEAGGDPSPSAVLTTASATVTGPFAINAVFSEPVTGLTPSDFVLSNAAAGVLSGSGAIYSLAITPSAPGAITVSLPGAAVLDATGNPGTPSNLLALTYVAPGDGQTPYGGIAIAIPGRIEAENFDEGGEGVAYSDTEAENFGLIYEGLDYRPGGVDIEPSFDTPATPSVGWLDAAEWLEYTIAVTPGTYDIHLRVASNESNPGDLRVYLDGVPLGTFVTAGTGGWYNWATLTLPSISLPSAGNHVLRIEAVGGGTNLNWIEFTASAGGDPPPTATLASASATVSGPFSVDVLFSEPVTGLAPSDFILTNGSATALSGTGSAYLLTVAPAAPGALTVTLPEATVTDGGGNPNTASNLLAITYVDPGAGQSPFGGVLSAFPGRIEAENFDEGGEGVAYSDVEPENLGLTFEGLDYRPGGVDIEPSLDSGGTPDVGWFEPGEWMEYSIGGAPGTYEIHLRVASALGDPGDLRVLIDGIVIGTAAVTNTGGWYNWVTLTLPAVVTFTDSGAHILRVEALGGGTNFNWIELGEAAPSTQELFDDFLIGHGITGSQGAAGGDPDGDGASNLREFALGTDPLSGTDPDPLRVSSATAGGETYFSLTFPALADGTFTDDGKYIASGVTYRPVASSDLENWNRSLSPAANPADLPPLPPGYVYLTYMLPMGEPLGFVCILIEADL